MAPRLSNPVLKSVALSAALIALQLFPAMAKGGNLTQILCLLISCFVLFVSTRWISPAVSLLLGMAVPLLGLLQGVYPSFPYALSASVANGLMVSVFSLFLKRSVLIGVLFSSFLRFVYCFVMVSRLIPLLPMQLDDSVTKTLQAFFLWPQLYGPILSGLLALPLLFSLQRKAEP